MKSHQRINQTSGKVEYYTPLEIIEAARSVLRVIDLDPASSEVANKCVCAGKFYSEDGLRLPWYGRVWMNHPFKRGENSLWVNKLVKSYKESNVVSALCITFAATSEAWFKPLLVYPQCFLVPRTNYLLPDGTLYRGVTKGSVVTYLGSELGRFKAAFERLGVCKIAM